MTLQVPSHFFRNPGQKLLWSILEVGGSGVVEGGLSDLLNLREEPREYLIGSGATSTSLTSMFPSASPLEALRVSGKKKAHCFPWGQSLSAYCHEAIEPLISLDLVSKKLTQMEGQ